VEAVAKMTRRREGQRERDEEKERKESDWLVWRGKRREGQRHPH
jgi:hypothetical protein